MAPSARKRRTKSKAASTLPIEPSSPPAIEPEILPEVSPTITNEVEEVVVSSKPELNDGSTPTPESLPSVRRIPASGRVWKSVQTKSHFQKRSSGEKTGWEKRQKDRKQLDILRTMKAELEQGRKEEKENKKKILEDRRKRKEENERKADVVQHISAAKVRRLKKKQLRGQNIRKK
ncbi:hypothetical protein BASA61_003181 [Batrachochytrium salamandrivorans]|nr:hypothetical protein BASA60_008298 [Batrachochytrium salamandrivorans]KAH6597329.1 hypothetical protein BASA61_003178 [Batrachochytrium salamandrivorans]KAH6597332.1 hypothetical protein BASA61_003181 [Batrachochytrium salamandrivorans]KAH9267675.1 hypothetical protein BASA84_000567 [Batrachochytrium salamandrivorans]